MRPNRYPPTLRALHWAIAVLILAALVMGTFVMAHMKNSDPSKLFALLKHMAVGGLILALTLLRLFIRPKTRRPRPMLSGISMADRIVPYVHRIFDVLVLVMAAGVNYNGVWAGLGVPISPFDGHKQPYHIAGSDASGIVWAVGDKVKQIGRAHV